MPIEAVNAAPQAQTPHRHKPAAGEPARAATLNCKDTVNLTGCSKETKHVVDKTLDAGTQGMTVANWAGTVGCNDGLSGVTMNSAAAINVARGIVDISVTGKVDTHAVAALATGAGTMLINRVPGAEVLVLVGSASALHYNQRAFKEAVRTRDPRALAGSVATIVQGAIGTTAAAAKAVSEVAEQGAKIGLFSEKSVAQADALAARATGIAGKSIIPFSAVGTVLSGWDWRKRAEHLDKVHERRLQVEAAQPDDIETDVKLKKQERTEVTNTHLAGVSFGLSSVSTAALSVAAFAPVTAPVAVPVAVAAGVGSAVTGLLAEPTVRTWAAHKLHIK